MYELEETETRQDYVFRKLQSGLFNLTSVAFATNISYAVLTRYARREIANANSNNIEELYEFLKGVSE